jgi:hypothetical protein
MSHVAGAIPEGPGKGHRIAAILIIEAQLINIAVIRDVSRPGMMQQHLNIVE